MLDVLDKSECDRRIQLHQQVTRRTAQESSLHRSPRCGRRDDHLCGLREHAGCSGAAGGRASRSVIAAIGCWRGARGAGIDRRLALRGGDVRPAAAGGVYAADGLDDQHLVYEESRLVTSVPVIYSEVWFPFAFGFLFFAFLFPMIRALLAGRRPRLAALGVADSAAGRSSAGARSCGFWSMTDVVVIAGIVAYFRASVPRRSKSGRRVVLSLRRVAGAHR